MKATSKLSRVIMILYGSLPFDTRVLREARALSNQGYDVTVLDIDWGLGNRQTNIKRDTIIKIPKMKRASFGGLIRFWFASLREMLKRRGSIDILHAHDLTGLPPAFVYALLNPRTKLVYDSHELFPEAALDKLSIISYVLFLGIELICCRRVDHLIAVSPMILRILNKRIPAKSSRVLNLPDITDLGEYDEVPKWKEHSDRDCVRVAYSGQVLTHRGYEIVVDAAQSLVSNHHTKFEFWIIGGGPFLEDLQELVLKRGLSDSFVFTGRVEFGELLALTASCDIAIALYQSTWNNNASISNKIFEYMLVGIPFIFTNLTQSLPILRRVDAEIISNPVTVSKLVLSLVNLCEDTERMKRISKESLYLISHRLTWKNEMNRLLNAYRMITSTT